MHCHVVVMAMMARMSVMEVMALMELMQAMAMAKKDGKDGRDWGAPHTPAARRVFQLRKKSSRPGGGGFPF